MKKLLSLTLALVMLLGMVAVVNAEEPTKLTLWTFIDQHATFYKTMAEKWNQENPDRAVELEATVLGYDDMHNKLKIALQSGIGAPDMCDVELGQFPNVLLGEPQLLVLNDYMKDYLPTVVTSRLEIYAKNGNYYGVPTHVGATVAFYNVELLDAAGIDYKTIVTWDDWAAAGLKLKAANPDLEFFTGYYPETGMLLRQKREMGWNVPMMGGDAANHQELVKIAGNEAATGYFVISPPLPQDMDTPEAKEFLKAFKAKYNTVPVSVWAVLAGDAFKVIEGALEAGKDTPKAMAAWLKELKGMPGLSGNLGFDAKGDRVG